MVFCGSFYLLTPRDFLIFSVSELLLFIMSPSANVLAIPILMCSCSGGSSNLLALFITAWLYSASAAGTPGTMCTLPGSITWYGLRERSSVVLEAP